MIRTRKKLHGVEPGRRARGFPLRVAALLLPVVLLASTSIRSRSPSAIPRRSPPPGPRQSHVTTRSASPASRLHWRSGFANIGLWMGPHRFMIGGVTTGHSRAVQVISRTIVSPKQQLMLVKVGRRLVLVANTSAGMNAICEIRDEQEVADLLGQVSAEQGDSVSRAFGSLFRREEDKFSSDEPAGDPDRPVPQQADSPETAAIGSTRDELSGLMEKVRLVSKQFRRS